MGTKIQKNFEKFAILTIKPCWNFDIANVDYSVAVRIYKAEKKVKFIPGL